MAEEGQRDSNCNTTTVKLLITSTDCDPKAELPFSYHTSVEWNAIIDALNHAKYHFAMRRLPPPSNPSKTRFFRTKVAMLSLQASKKAAFLYRDDDFEHKNYQISYDENLMNDLPSFCNLKGLPRFHLFTSLPEDLQLNVVKLLDGVGFARMRCVSRHFSRIRWDRHFNILRYSHPEVRTREPQRHEYFLDSALLLRLASAVCFAAVVYGILTKVPSGVFVDAYDDEECE